MVWLWRQVGARLYRGNKLHQGSRSTPKGLVMKEYVNAVKNYRILTRKDLEDTRELTGHEKG